MSLRCPKLRQMHKQHASVVKNAHFVGSTFVIMLCPPRHSFGKLFVEESYFEIYNHLV